ncbi:N-acetylmuramoyl-L-alanine amidase [Megasphaera paucivorans]|uniref:N-acetylmuramoyl-L-alanine amidase n=1 Tax=Megasphaera paucivorans TaxID=349095 RepID=A0A1G9QYF2_9FIRM|nr:N-acetylmuramoyl-L-alanine amidase [Megasphaera paucivorans]SDM15627.1 N-acetylmuramoyl-L-alanine amidase [Megasphaera paucivorans]
MKVFINPGHDQNYDSGAVNPNSGLKECDVVARVGNRVKNYLEAAGCEVQLLQSDNLYFDSQYNDRPVAVCVAANDWPADIFISIHCNAANTQARGTEVECYDSNDSGGQLAQCIQSQIINSIGTVDRGVKEMPGLIVLKHTNMPSCLVEMAFIDNKADAQLLIDSEDDFARAIARGITDYEGTL